MSSACIDPETSTVSAIDASSLATVRRTSGRASAASAQRQREQRRAPAARSARQRDSPATTRGEHLDVRVLDGVAGAPPLEREVGQHRERHDQQREQRERPLRSSLRTLRLDLDRSPDVGGQTRARVALTSTCPPRVPRTTRTAASCFFVGTPRV